MKCQRCNRPMTTPAATVQTRAGIKGYGPKCAAVMGIGPSRMAVTAKRRPATHAAPADERQADWIGAAA